MGAQVDELRAFSFITEASVDCTSHIGSRSSQPLRVCVEQPDDPGAQHRAPDAPSRLGRHRLERCPAAYHRISGDRAESFSALTGAFKVGATGPVHRPKPEQEGVSEAIEEG